MNRPNAAEPQPPVQQDGKAATTCSCTSHATVSHPPAAGLSAFRRSALLINPCLSHALPRICRFLSLCPSLTSVLNPELTDSTPVLDDSPPKTLNSMILSCHRRCWLSALTGQTPMTIPVTSLD